MSEYEANDGKNEENEEGEEEQDEEASADDAYSDQHLILKVVEIASVASRTSRLANEAEQRHQHLIELTKAAKAEVDSIREIAGSLTQTAASAARVALEVCRYSSAQEAFERHSDHCCRLMDLESFLEVVSNSMDKVDATDEEAISDSDRANDCMTTVAMVNDDDGDDAVSMVKSKREGGEVLNDCSCQKQLGCRSLDVNWKEHMDQRHPLFHQNGHNFPSSPDFRSCCFSCISLSDSSLASSGSEARFADRERGSEDERVLMAKQNSSVPKILPQLQLPLRPDSTTKLKGRGCLLEVSSDSEVEEILQRKPVESPAVQKLRNLELRTTDSLDCSDLIAGQKRPDKQNRRPVSPLLDNNEKDNYAVSGEEVSRNSPKHLFTPPVSVINSAEQINKRLTLS